MLKLIVYALISGIAFTLGVNGAYAETQEIESVSVLADKRLAVPLSELASLYAQKNSVTVSGAFGTSPEQEKRIEDGEAADLFITANPQLVQDLKTKGLVDVYSIGRLASGKDMHFTAAVVAGENMTSARHYLAFLKSPEARSIFRKNGFSAP
jgi:ABC-type molybdate transport system substrate-binding protein